MKHIICEILGAKEHEIRDSEKYADFLLLACEAAGLSPKEVNVLVMRGNGATFREIGELLGITRERARQQVYKMFQKIRHPTAATHITHLLLEPF